MPTAGAVLKSVNLIQSSVDKGSSDVIDTNPVPMDLEPEAELVANKASEIESELREFLESGNRGSGANLIATTTSTARTTIASTEMMMQH